MNVTWRFLLIWSQGADSELDSAPRIASSKLADGVWLVAGGSHNSLAVEFKDFTTVIEAPLNDARSQAVIANVKKRIPGKPIRYVVNTHHHFEHSGGLRAYVAEGSTIVTHKVNRPLYEKVLPAPHLSPEQPKRAAEVRNLRRQTYPDRWDAQIGALSRCRQRTQRGHAKPPGKRRDLAATD